MILVCVLVYCAQCINYVETTQQYLLLSLFFTFHWFLQGSYFVAFSLGHLWIEGILHLHLKAPKALWFKNGLLPLSSYMLKFLIHS